VLRDESALCQPANALIKLHSKTSHFLLFVPCFGTWALDCGTGPPHLTKAVASVQQWVNFSSRTPNQDAIALSLIKAREPYENFDSYYNYLASEYHRKRDLLADALSMVDVTTIMPAGGFFIIGDASRIKFPEKYLKEVTEAMPSNPMPRDWAMSRWMTIEVGVTALPPSAFYSKETLQLAENTLRFAFCKRDVTLLEARDRLPNKRLLKNNFCSH